MFEKVRNDREQCQTICRLSKRDATYFEVGNMSSDLSPCFYLLYFIGIFPSCNQEIKAKKVYFIFVRKIATAIIHAIWFYIFFISFLTTIHLSRQFKTDFTICLVNALVVLIRFAVHHKMHKVKSIIKSIEIFYSSVSKEDYKRIKTAIKAFCYGATLAAVAMCIISTEHMKISDKFNRFSRDFIFGMNVSNDSSFFLQYFPIVIFTSTIFYQNFIPLAVCIYISSIFYILRKAIGKFVESIRYDRLEGVPDVSTYLLKFSQITTMEFDGSQKQLPC